MYDTISGFDSFKSIMVYSITNKSKYQKNVGEKK